MNGPFEPPYYAVIFSSRLSGEDADGYAAMARRMVELAREQPGFLGMDSARGGDGFGITVSYWRDLAAVEAWRVHTEHLEAQSKGRDIWYAKFDLHVARVERSRKFKS